MAATSEGTSAGVFEWRGTGKTANASTAYSWNVSIPDLPGSGTPTIRYVIYDDLLLGSSTTFSTVLYWNSRSLDNVGNKSKAGNKRQT